VTLLALATYGRRRSFQYHRASNLQLSFSGGSSLEFLGGPPPEAEILLAFGRSLEAANLSTFLKFGNAKKSQISVLSLQK